MKTSTPLLALALAAAGCAYAPPRHYYMLSSPLPPAAAAAPHPFTLRVKDLSVGAAYAGDAMVVRQDANEIAYYQERRWTDRPQRMVSDAIRKHLRAAGLFQQVTERLTDKAPDFTLEGALDAIEEQGADGASFAHLALSLQLVRASDGKVIWQHELDRRKKVDGQGGRLVVRALSALLEQEMGEVVAGLDAVLGDRAAPAQAPQPTRAATAP